MVTVSKVQNACYNKVMRWIFLTVIFASLAACSSTSSLHTAANGQHRVTTLSSVNGNAALDAMNKASDYCAHQHQQVIVTSFSSNYKAVDMPTHYQYQADVGFTCAPIRPSNL
jgi:hypothetical protein